MQVSHALRRLFPSGGSWLGQRRLHLGCGERLLPGWANVDIDGPPGAIRHDLTRPLPLPLASVEFIYSEHFIEHVTRPEALALLRECHRLLEPGGVLRLSTPDLGKLIGEYRAGRTSEWHDMGWRPQTACQMVNEGMRLWGHQFLYDAAELESLLREAGFAGIVREQWGHSRHPALQGLESRPFHGELIVEATKPS